MPTGQPLPPHLYDMGIGATTIGGHPVAAPEKDPATPLPQMSYSQQQITIPVWVGVTIP